MASHTSPWKERPINSISKVPSQWRQIPFVHKESGIHKGDLVAALCRHGTQDDYRGRNLEILEYYLHFGKHRSF